MFQEYNPKYTSFTDRRTATGHHLRQFELYRRQVSDRVVTEGPWERLPEELRESIKSYTHPIYRQVEYRKRPIFDGFISTAVEAFCRAVLLEYHKPREERYILLATDLQKFIFDYLFRLIVI